MSENGNILIELSPAQREFLIVILEGVQLSGTTKQIRETLAMIDSILKEVGKDE